MKYYLCVIIIAPVLNTLVIITVRLVFSWPPLFYFAVLSKRLKLVKKDSFWAENGRVVTTKEMAMCHSTAWLITIVFFFESLCFFLFVGVFQSVIHCFYVFKNNTLFLQLLLVMWLLCCWPIILPNRKSVFIRVLKIS